MVIALRQEKIEKSGSEKVLPDLVRFESNESVSPKTIKHSELYTHKS